MDFYAYEYLSFTRPGESFCRTRSRSRSLTAAAGRQRWGHGHAVTTKFWVGEIQITKSTYPPKKNLSSDFGQLTRALEKGGRFCPPLMFFVNIFRSIRSIAVIFSIPAQK